MTGPTEPVEAPTVPSERGAAGSTARRKRWPLVLAALAAIGFLLLFFVGSTELLHWTESAGFCSMCHVMAPEFTAYENSAHARAECGTCHIGPGAVAAIQAKFANARYLWVYPTNRYERPIPSPIHSLRPVEVVCEQCHWPQKIYADRVVVKNEYGTDAANSLTQVALNVRTGGGSSASGFGRGIHWHIENPVYYIATDEKRQEIPWVSAEYNGVVTEYVSVDSNLTPDALAQYEKRKLDCVDCHNRASHNFRRPAEVVDEALTNGTLPNLPNIKEQAVKVLETQYATEAEAATAIAAVADYYKNEQSAVYAQREAEVTTAVGVLQDIFNRTQFPFMNVTWQSHPNNIGHKDFPGCFRCHDGKHLSGDNQVIRLECNVCHTIPEVAGPGQVLQPVASVKPANEPDSHRSTTWLAEHRFQFNATCATCHTVDNAGGSDNSSFCSNAACHATEWQYAGLNAPKIRELSQPVKSPSTGAPDPIPHPINQTTDCKICHAVDKVRPFPATHVNFTNDICSGCHVPSVPAGPNEPAPLAAPPIPHQLEGMGECLLCHRIDGTVPYPANHTSITVDLCGNCHKPAEVAATPTPAPAPAANPEATPTAGGAGTGGAAGIGPAIPHELTGREACLVCHDPSGGLKPAPPDHAGRANDTCQACHKPR